MHYYLQQNKYASTSKLVATMLPSPLVIRVYIYRYTIFFPYTCTISFLYTHVYVNGTCRYALTQTYTDADARSIHIHHIFPVWPTRRGEI